MYINLKFCYKKRKTIRFLEKIIRKTIRIHDNKEKNLLLNLKSTWSIKKTKRITTLKSPHVNKKSQETYEWRLTTKKLRLYSSDYFRTLVLLNSIKKDVMSNVGLKIKLEKNLDKHKQNPKQYNLRGKKDYITIKKYVTLVKMYGHYYK